MRLYKGLRLEAQGVKFTFKINAFWFARAFPATLADGRDILDMGSDEPAVAGRVFHRITVTVQSIRPRAAVATR